MLRINNKIKVVKQRDKRLNNEIYDVLLNGDVK